MATAPAPHAALRAAAFVLADFAQEATAQAINSRGRTSQPQDKNEPAKAMRKQKTFRPRLGFDGSASLLVCGYICRVGGGQISLVSAIFLTPSFAIKRAKRPVSATLGILIVHWYGW